MDEETYRAELARAAAKLDGERARRSSSARGSTIPMTMVGAMPPLERGRQPRNALPSGPPSEKQPEPAALRGGRPDDDPERPPPPHVCQRHGEQAPRWRERPAVLYRHGGAWVACCWDCRAEEETRKVSDGEKQRARIVERQLAAVGSLQSFRRVADLDSTPTNFEVIDWAAEPKTAGGAYLWGMAGRGKSTILEAICVDACYGGLMARYWLLGDLLAKAKAGFDTDGPDVIEEAARADVLVIDNLDGVRLTDWGRSVISELAQRRYQIRSRAWTGWGATVSPADAADMLDLPALTSRWLDWGPVFSLRGPDRRAGLKLVRER